MRSGRAADERARLESGWAARPRGFESLPLRHPMTTTRERVAAVTLLDLGRMASRMDTSAAHAMLHAVAVAMSEGSAWGWATA